MTVEAAPDRVHEGDSVTFSVRNAPVDAVPGVPNRDPSTWCLLYIESPMGNGLGLTVMHPDLTITLPIFALDPLYDVGDWPRHWTVRLFRWNEFFRFGDIIPAKAIATALFIVSDLEVDVAPV